MTKILFPVSDATPQERHLSFRQIAELQHTPVRLMTWPEKKEKDKINLKYFFPSREKMRLEGDVLRLLYETVSKSNQNNAFSVYSA